MPLEPVTEAIEVLLDAELDHLRPMACPPGYLPGLGCHRAHRGPDYSAALRL
jgi:hypothetical protein